MRLITIGLILIVAGVLAQLFEGYSGISYLIGYTAGLIVGILLTKDDKN